MYQVSNGGKTQLEILEARIDATLVEEVVPNSKENRRETEDDRGMYHRKSVDNR
jgi:hypothetical protein